MTAKIYLVTSDLTHQETILQIVDALDHLDQVTEAVFARIQSRIDENGKKLADLDQRVDVADKKVKRLAEMSKKATCLYSSAKYPESGTTDSFSAFTDLEEATKFSNDSNIKLIKSQGNVKGLDSRTILEKKRFYSLPIKKKPTTSQILEENPDLREPPKSPQSALSFLIFNTAENPYTKQRLDFVNPLNQKSKSARNDDTSDDASEGLGEAPTGLGLGLNDDVDGTSNLFFAPALGDLPDLDLPDILDLPNLPTDLSYAMDLGPGIAPSAQSVLAQDFNSDVAALLAAPPPPPPPSALPPPPSQSIASRLEEIPKLDSQSVLSKAPVVAEIPKLVTIPPPPPPIASPSVEPAPTTIDAPDGSSASAPVNADEGRASLMAAIRSAGGKSKAGLKSVKERKLEGKKAKQEELEQQKAGAAATSSGGSKSGSGDLMSDLANKLAMRRKGISGRPPPGETGPAAATLAFEGPKTTMDKISSMIPSIIPDDDDNDREASSDDDWN